ncbi:hypothetical protein BLNAU_5491 [Blattamonas nauphoetae]|uniref:Uncharacterized protein n=1 Tax=Blattamonas nauphoetae TaxID=2049346 RepID=A0ABQ9Y6Q1_9EUKA|nr:hypothetical protein BLNAU_5491 [Blattamonas nauphoetae]
MTAEPPIEVDSEIVLELLVLVKEALPMILWTISFIDNLIASLPSDSSSTTPLISGDDTHVVDSLDNLKDKCEECVSDGWNYLLNWTYSLTTPLKSAFQTIIIDDPSFPYLILSSLQLSHEDVKVNIIITILNIVLHNPWMKENLITSNFIGMIFETVDFVSLPLSESETQFQLTKFLYLMVDPIGKDEDTIFEQYRHIRVSVFEPAKKFITFIRADHTLLNEYGDFKILPIGEEPTGVYNLLHIIDSTRDSSFDGADGDHLLWVSSNSAF